MVPGSKLASLHARLYCSEPSLQPFRFLISDLIIQTEELLLLHFRQGLRRLTCGTAGRGRVGSKIDWKVQRA